MLWMTLALADVVGPPARGCPPGSTGTSSHAGPYCMPDPPAETCAEGSLRTTGLCVLEEERQCAGNAEPDCTYLHREALSRCDGAGDCSGENVTCEVADRCAPGCGCSTGAAPGLALLAGLLPLVFRRRGA